MKVILPPLASQFFVEMVQQRDAAEQAIRGVTLGAGIVGRYQYRIIPETGLVELTQMPDDRQSVLPVALKR